MARDRLQLLKIVLVLFALMDVCLGNAKRDMHYFIHSFIVFIRHPTERR